MPVLGMRHTANLEATERPKAWRLGILDEYPDAAPLMNVVTRIGKEKVSDPEFNWYERRFATRELTVNAGDVPDQQTAGVQDTVQVGSGEAYNAKLGSLGINTTTLERVLVYQDPSSGNVLNIIRGVGSTGNQGTWASGQKLQIFSNAQAEGAGVGSAITTDPSKKYNYTQIVRNVADTSGTLSATLLRTGDKRKDAQKQALLNHELDKEWNAMLGIASEDLTATPGPRRTTAGLLSVINTNVSDFSSGLTLNGWNTALAAPLSSGSSEKLLLLGSTALLVLENMARAYSYQWADVGKQDSFGMSMRRWITSFGTVYIKEHKLLSKSSTFKTWGFLVDTQNITYRFVQGRDTEWFQNRQDNGADRFIGEYLAEIGFEIQNEYESAIFKNINQFVG